jgi:hypothetical protein
MQENGPPSPPGEGGSGGTNEPPIYGLNGYGTNDLWLEILTLTNATAFLTIHPPWNVSNGVYDLLYTTNLTPTIAWQ